MDGCELLHPRVLHAPSIKFINTDVVNHAEHHEELEAPSPRETRVQKSQTEGAALRDAESSVYLNRKKFAVEVATATREAEPEKDVAAGTLAAISASAEEAAEVEIAPAQPVKIKPGKDTAEETAVVKKVGPAEGGSPEIRIPPRGKTLIIVRLDFLESVTIKSPVSKKAKTEVFPLILVCQATGVVRTQVAYHYTTRAFLLQWDHFIAANGRPSRVESDQGSQRTSSDNHSKSDLLDWEKVVEREAEQRTAWEFVSTGSGGANPASNG